MKVKLIGHFGVIEEDWQKGNGLRIDHFLTSSEITDLIKKVKINREPRGWEKASDHTPVTIDI